MLDGCGLIAGDAGVTAVVNLRQVWDAQWASEVYVVDGDTQAGINWSSIFVPGYGHGQVAGYDHTGDEDTLTDGSALRVGVLDQRRHWERERRSETDMQTIIIQHSKS